jgi:mono/diheme cytochrome c family protein
MGAVKTPRALIVLLAVLALMAAVVVAGCGGGSGTTTTATEAAEAGGEEAAGEGAIVAEGKEIFVANCGSCHTLEAAGTNGTAGPDLDEVDPEEAAVESQVINGGGAMPAFGKKGILDAEEIKAVATFVSHEAGKG